MDDEELQSYKVAFAAFDLNGDGKISASELKNVLAKMRLELEDTKLRELTELWMKEFDKDNSGSIDFDEFLKFVEFIQNIDAQFYRRH